MNTKLTKFAEANFLGLSQKPFKGRGIVVGVDEKSNNLVQICWNAGQIENTRKCVYRDSGKGDLGIYPTANTEGNEYDQYCYSTMCEPESFYVVGSGKQTGEIFTDISRNQLFGLERALSMDFPEHDSPIFTPRITAVIKVRNTFFRTPYTGMSIIRKSPFGEECDRQTYELNPGPGFGYCLTTYSGEDFSLQPFQGHPLIVPIHGDIKLIAETYWATLGLERVSLAVKFINRRSGRSRIYIINKY